MGWVNECGCLGLRQRNGGKRQKSWHHLWLIHGLCALPALNPVPIYSGRQLLSFCRFCQLRILLQFSPNTTLVPNDSDFSLVPSCSHNLLYSSLCVLRPAPPVAPQHELQTSIDCISGDRQGPPDTDQHRLYFRWPPMSALTIWSTMQVPALP